MFIVHIFELKRSKLSTVSCSLRSPFFKYIGESIAPDKHGKTLALLHLKHLCPSLSSYASSVDSCCVLHSVSKLNWRCRCLYQNHQ